MVVSVYGPGEPRLALGPDFLQYDPLREREMGGKVLFGLERIVTHGECLFRVLIGYDQTEDE